METLKKAIEELKSQKSELQSRLMVLDSAIVRLEGTLRNIDEGVLDSGNTDFVEIPLHGAERRSRRKPGRTDRQIDVNSNEYLLWQYAVGHGNKISPHEARDVLLEAKPGAYVSPRTAKGAAASVLCRSRRFERVSTGIYKVVDRK